MHNILKTFWDKLPIEHALEELRISEERSKWYKDRAESFNEYINQRLSADQDSVGSPEPYNSPTMNQFFTRVG